MKKGKKLVFLGLLVVLLAMGLVLVGCPEDDGSPSSNNNNNGNPDNGGVGTLNIRLVSSPDNNTDMSTILISAPSVSATIYVKYQDSNGNWARTNSANFSFQWFKNNASTPFSSYKGDTSWGEWETVTKTGAYNPNGNTEVNNGDTIKVIVTHTDGRTASKSASIMYYP